MIPAKPKIVTTESEFMNSQIPLEPIPVLWSIYLLHLEFSSLSPRVIVTTDVGTEQDRLLLVALIGPDTLCGLWIVCVMIARGSSL